MPSSIVGKLLETGVLLRGREDPFIRLAVASKAMNGSFQPMWTGLYHTGQQLGHLPNYQLYFTDDTVYDILGEVDIHKIFWVPINDHYQPDNHGTDQREYCIELLQFGDNIQLNDQFCDYHLQYHVCKYDPETAGHKKPLPSEVINGEKSASTSASPQLPIEQQQEFQEEYVVYDHATLIPSMPRSSLAIAEQVVTEVITEPDVPLPDFVDNNSYCRCKGLSPTVWHTYLALAGVSFPIAIAAVLAMWVKLIRLSMDGNTVCYMQMSTMKWITMVEVC
uniref:C-type lectin domain-containing protein n=1 Tax=Ditylenchus dipsaci TaxID=166011 RepID=A0A915DHF9_9BILA